MESTMFKELGSELERLNALKTMCYKTENKAVTDTYDSAEMIEHLESWRNKSQELEEELQIFKKTEADFKAFKKKMEIEIGSHRSVLMYQTFTSEQEVYLFPDHKEGMMGIYNSKGDLISTRRLLPDERQVNIFDEINKTGTNN